MASEAEIEAVAHVIDHWLWHEVSVRDAAIAALDAAEKARTAEQKRPAHTQTSGR